MIRYYQKNYSSLRTKSKIIYSDLFQMTKLNQKLLVQFLKLLEVSWDLGLFTMSINILIYYYNISQVEFNSHFIHQGSTNTRIPPRSCIHQKLKFEVFHLDPTSENSQKCIQLCDTIVLFLKNASSWWFFHDFKWTKNKFCLFLFFKNWLCF